jgi:hypothetical protein
LVLFPVIIDKGAAKFTWKNAPSDTILVAENDRFENQDIPFLIITANTLQASTDYHFEFTVLYSEGIEIASRPYYSLQNSPPSCGQSTISPLLGNLS